MVSSRFIINIVIPDSYFPVPFEFHIIRRMLSDVDNIGQPSRIEPIQFELGINNRQYFPLPMEW